MRADESGSRDRARGRGVLRRRGRRRSRAHRAGSRPVAGADPARGRQDADARRREGPRVRQAWHHDGAVPLGGAHRPAGRGTARRWLRRRHPGLGGLQGHLARRVAAPRQSRRPGEDRQTAQAVGAYAVHRRQGAQRQRNPFAPVPLRELPHLPARRPGHAPRIAGRTPQRFAPPHGELHEASAPQRRIRGERPGARLRRRLVGGA